MGRATKIKEAVKDYIWGDGLDTWNTPSHKVHDFPFTNPLHDLVIWNTGGKGVVALARHQTEKLLSGDYNDMLTKPFGGRPTIYKPIRSSKNYKSSSSSLSSYQQNGGGGDTPSIAEVVVALGFLGSKVHEFATEKQYPKHPAMRCRPGFVEKRVNGKLMCVPSTRK